MLCRYIGFGIWCPPEIKAKFVSKSELKTYTGPYNIRCCLACNQQLTKSNTKHWIHCCLYTVHMYERQRRYVCAIAARRVGIESNRNHNNNNKYVYIYIHIQAGEESRVQNRTNRPIYRWQIIYTQYEHMYIRTGERGKASGGLEAERRVSVVK